MGDITVDDVASCEQSSSDDGIGKPTENNNIDTSPSLAQTSQDLGSAREQNNLISSDSRKPSIDKRVRFSEKIENVNIEESSTNNDLSLQSAVSRETRVVWEMITDGQKEAVKWPHKDSTASTDSVFVYDQPEDALSGGKMVTDLDEDDEPNKAIGGRNVFKDLLEVRKLENASVSAGDGGLEAGGGGAASHSTHSCGSLFAQCGAHRGQGHSLVTTFSQGRLKHVESDDTYDGPVSLTEILHERDAGPSRMCLMGNGVSNIGKGERSPEGPVAGAGAVAVAGAGVVVVLKNQIKQWEERSTELGEEVAELRKEVKRKDHEILRLQREVHKLKVLKLYLTCSNKITYCIKEKLYLELTLQDKPK
ncbi:uncharacterized protein LOC129005310 [Macrosteles quadrilineatus]|uniref:uncharacterized protein LOC129005310 n=1 Tax=Macrosteles quadrilineatus TaxID=74068 RepID=UPI0023E154C1|nr:uncharacterized protein LOC129005310 [Macrosteles quadrilineatus]